jgi:Terminase RNaseH-like domain
MSRAYIVGTIDDADHFSAEQKAEVIAGYPAHERDARTKGIPSLGSGRIFPVPEETITCDHREIPPHWPRIAGLDWGYDHPFAAAELAHDRDSDTVYLVRCYRVRQATPVQHCAALRPWGEGLRYAWPRDGNRETLEGAGIALAAQYRELGLNLLSEYSHYLEGNGQKSVSVEAGIFDMLTRMETGRFKVFREHLDFFDEYRLYHRRDGKVFKENDDLICAVRYGIMMLRFAQTARAYKDFRRPLTYPKVAY